MTNEDIVIAIHAAMSQREALLAEGKFEEASRALDDALSALYGHQLGEREEARLRDLDPAEDFEPDISDVGFDAFQGTYTDDC